MIYGFHDCKVLPNSIEGNSMPVVDKSGVIYDVQVPTNFLEEKPEHMPTIFVHHHQTEKGQTLYGFNCVDDRDLFRDLITVDGFGPAGALKLMSAFTPAKIKIDIADGDTQSLSKAKGLGKKTCEKIVLKLGDKYEKHKTDSNKKEMSVELAGSYDGVIREVGQLVTKALVKLGYPSRESKEKAVGAIKELMTRLEYKESFMPGADINTLVERVVRVALR